MADVENAESLLPYAPFAAVCCLGIEVLGGAVILGGLAAKIGFSTGLTYLVVVGIGGILAALLAIGYRQLGGRSHV